MSVELFEILMFIALLALFLELWGMISDSETAQKFDQMIITAFIITMWVIVCCAFIVAHGAKV